MPAHNYHGTQVAWRQAKNLDGNFVGLELETHNPDGRVATVAVVDALEPYDRQKSICEMDGSICPIRGIEVITPPIKLAQAIRAGGYVENLVKKLVDEAHCTVNPEKNYGMHININVRGMEDQSKHNLNLWLYLLKSVCQKIGGRTGEAREHPDYWTPQVRLVEDQAFVLTTNNKYNPVWLRAANNNVIEIRYPKAILDFISIKTNISLIFSVKAFVETAPAKYVAAYAAYVQSRAEIRSPLSQPVRDALTEVYLSWLSKQRNFKKLYAAIDRPALQRRSYTLQEAKDYAKETIRVSAAVQEQAVMWCDRIAERF